MNPIDTAKRYIELFNTQQFTAMGELFAEDSIWEGPTAQTPIRGRVNIIATYSAMEQMNMDLQMTGMHFHRDGNTVIAEIATHSSRGPAGRVADVFEIDHEGRIVRMTGYASVYEIASP
ncbi:MAG: nuclear transport factor 2 family protein [Candidatus Nanopelagicales bacterium]|nr:nuclear transport factor 2 family protein [Candidatus Nanopelagicales bacterium]